MKTAQKVQIESDVVCPNCGKKMLVRTSRFGSQFLGCSGYPECKTILSMNPNGEVKTPEEDVAVEEKCEKCQGEMVLKTGPYGKYIECKECKNRKKYIVSTGVKCPKCGEGDIIEKKSKYGKVFYGCNKYPNCDFALWDPPTGDKCPTCGELLIKRVGKGGDKIVCSSRKCNYKLEVVTPDDAIAPEIVEE